MIKRIVISGILFLCMAAKGMAGNIEIVEEFGNCLSTWASTRNPASSIPTLRKLCSSKKPAFRIADKLMESLASKNNLEHKNSYFIENYITCLQKEIDKGISISFSNIQPVPENLINHNYQGVEYVACKMKISGAANYDENELFILKDGKIAKIQEYEVFEDSKGRRRLKVDLSDLDMDESKESFGLSYNYSKAFPLGASFSYSKGKFMLSLDFGISPSKDSYTTQAVEFNNLMDYKIARGDYDLKYYLGGTPSVYLKYVSIGCGLGMTCLKGTMTTDEKRYSENENGDIQVISSSITDDKAELIKLMVTPKVKGFIPCSDNLFITLSAGYNWIAGYKAKSGMEFGIGINYIID